MTPVVGVAELGEGGGDVAGAGSSHGVVLSHPHGKDSVAPRPHGSKRATDPSEPWRLAKKKCERPTPVLVLTG